jgi:hypothetical protein
MTNKMYEPQINLTVFDNAGRHKRLLHKVLPVVLLLVIALALVKSAGWVRQLLAGGSDDSYVNTTFVDAKKPGPDDHARSRRSSQSRSDIALAPGSTANLTITPGMRASVVRLPLAVEAISDDGTHRMIPTRNGSVFLDSPHKIPPVLSDIDAEQASGVINAADKSRLSPAPAEIPLHPAEALFSEGMKAPIQRQDAVVLLARIGRDGSIENVQLKSGPETLFAAARQAVEEWHFKPYYVAGQPVETEAEITVNFAISVH